MLIKLGESMEILRIENTQSCVPAVSEDVLENFRKFATNLKKIAPKAENFLYFSAVMMHAAEAAAINNDGTSKLLASGEPVKVGWRKDGGTWRWESNDPNIKPYSNSNGDIFPEEELVKAYKKWVHKPLCIDHKSNSVDHVRGFIVDTYYDRSLKRVIALCALDKENYPDLARKVATGYSTSVSMGTAVGKAICTDCGRVARVESDFCDHMRHKTGYGEINIDLNPIELSIVVNGADPKAHIKHIIAAANNLNEYVDRKNHELNKVAEHFTGDIFVITDGFPEDGEMKESHSVKIEGKTIEELKDSFEKAVASLEELKKDTNNAAFNQSSGSVAMGETDTPNTDSGLAPPHVRYASTDVEANLTSELRAVMSSVEAKLSQMKDSLDKIEKTSTKLQEENMSGQKMNKEGYFQGAQGDEPTPGKSKYPVDPTNDKLRTDGDKHMDTDDTGPVEGLYPGDLERKKMLARAEAEERALKRNAVVQAAKKALENKKNAYFQQGDKNPEEPTPGKPKYPVDPINTNLREKEDKQMVGAKPFPEVGPVDGLYPGDKETKEKLSRASLAARFKKVSNNDGTQNLGASSWNVYLGDKLLLTASVNELSGGRAGMLYDTIATKEFGGKLLEKVKVLGADKVRDLVKSAQGAPAPAPEAASAPAPAPEAAPEVEEPEMPEDVPEDTGKSGDPSETAVELSEKVRDLSSDLVEAVKALTGEQSEMGELEAAPEMGATASDTRTLNTLRKELNGALTHAMKEAIAELEQHEQELDMIAGMYAKGVKKANKELVGSIVDDALTEAKACVADGMKLMTAFIKYARGTEAIVKRAEIERELYSLAEGEVEMDVKPGEDNELDQLMADTDEDLCMVEEALSAEDDVPAPGQDDIVFPEEDIKASPLPVEPGSGEDVVFGDEYIEGDVDEADIPVDTEGKVDFKNLQSGDKVTVASMKTKEGRAALRAKLAADTLVTCKMPSEAHPGGGVTTQLDVKPSGDLAKVEVLEETQKAMMDLAKAPPKVRKEAEAIHMLVSTGRLEPTDENFAAMVAEGLDSAAVAYYKKYFGQTDGGSEFASELVKEHVKAQIEEELANFKIKMARAYELTYDMVSRGLCPSSPDAISSQVDELMTFSDGNFESLKRVVSKHEPKMRKEAGVMPQVGMFGSGEYAPQSDDGNLVSQLSAVLSQTKKGVF